VEKKTTRAAGGTRWGEKTHITILYGEARSVAELPEKWGDSFFSDRPLRDRAGRRRGTIGGEMKWLRLWGDKRATLLVNQGGPNPARTQKLW